MTSSRLLTLPALMVLAAIAGCTQHGAGAVSTLNGVTMGTTWSVKLNDTPLPRSREELLGEITRILDDVDGRMSTYREDSELTRLNRNTTTDWITVSAPLFEVLRTAQDVSRLTGGAFDVTVGPLVNLWGFGPEGRPVEIPDTAAIAEVRRRTGYRFLALDTERRAIRREIPGLYIDLSGIAKGYAVDRIADYLSAAGARNFMVEIGGEIRARGRNADGDAWRIGIEQPAEGRHGVEHVIGLADTGMATSGDYRNFYVEDGTRYSHTIDPATGRPVPHRLASVTVIHPSAMRADALATAFMVLGPERGLRLAQQENLAVLFIMAADDGFETLSTDPFTRYMAK